MTLKLAGLQRPLPSRQPCTAPLPPSKLIQLRGLLTLPNEIILLIAGHIKDARSLNSLARANRFFNVLLTQMLYGKFSSKALQWALRAPDREGTAVKIVDNAGKVTLQVWLYDFFYAAILYDWVELAQHAATAFADCVPYRRRHEGLANMWGKVRPQVGLYDLVDYSYYGPIQLAALLRRVSVLGILLAYNFDHPNRMDFSGVTPLGLAVRKGDIEVAEVLLAHPRTKPNAREKSGQSPLAVAVQRGKKDMVQMLLRHPAIRVNSIDFDGRTPLDWAKSVDRPDLVELLRRNGAVEGSEAQHIKKRRRERLVKTAVTGTNLYHEMPEGWGDLFQLADISG